MVLLEISYLGAKGRIEDVDDLGVRLDKVAESFRVIPISSEIARLVLELDLPHRDPFDRVIAATAKTHQSSFHPINTLIKIYSWCACLSFRETAEDWYHRTKAGDTPVPAPAPNPA